MSGAPPPPRVAPRPPLAVGVSILAGPGDVPRWCATLTASIEAHPALELRAFGLEPGTAAPSANAEAPVRALLRAIDRPRWPADAPVPPASVAPAGRRAGPDALGRCEVVIELDVRGADGRTTRALAPGSRLWRIDARRVEAEIEASLLAGLDVGDLVLRERLADAAGTPDPERVRAVHALPAQSFSRRDRMTAAFGALPAFVEAALVRLHRGVDELVPDAGRLTARDRLLAPGHGGTAGASRRRLVAACRLALRQLSVRARDRFTEERWELAWCPDPLARADGIEALLARPVADWHALLDAPGRVRADPHALAGPHGIDLWFEELPDGSERGHVAHARLERRPDPGGGDGAVVPHAAGGDPGPALRSDRHLSYPFVFEHEGVRRMVPETARHGRVELWREDGSPRRWRLERTLLDGVDATDTTLLRHGGAWWLFTNAMSHRSVDERDLLLLYRADALDGEWRAHPANPIVRGVERARMAGAVLELNGALVRPSQYGARRYGHGLNLARIDVLDAERYAETPLGRIVPDGRGGWLGLHTLSRAGGALFADRLRRRPRAGSAGLAGLAVERLAAALARRGRGAPRRVR